MAKKAKRATSAAVTLGRRGGTANVSTASRDNGGRFSASGNKRCKIHRTTGAGRKKKK